MSLDISKMPILRRMCLYIDGLSRILALLFGLASIYLQQHQQQNNDPNSHAAICYIAVLLSTNILGQYTGTIFYAYLLQEKSLQLFIRIIGLASALIYTTIKIGMVSLHWFLIIQFISAVLVGTLHCLTRNIDLPENEGTSLQYDRVGSSTGTTIKHAMARIRPGTVLHFTSGSLCASVFAYFCIPDESLQKSQAEPSFIRIMIFTVLVGLVTEVALSRYFIWSERRNSRYNLKYSSSLDVPMISVPDSIHSTDDCDSIFNDDASISDDDSYGNEAADRFDTLSTPINMSRTPSFVSPARRRGESYTSIDDFYDCVSVMSDAEIPLSASPIQPDNDYEEARYVDGEVIYSDGSPAYVPADCAIAEIPANFLKFFNNNHAKAQIAWEKTQQWRRENQVWRIHKLPNTWFNDIKAAYPHFVHGYSKNGYPVVYEQPGRMNLKELFCSGCSVADMVHHYIYFLEFISNHLCTKDEVVRKNVDKDNSWGILVVMDVKNAGLSHLSGDVIKYLKQAGDINSGYYPLSMKRAFVINSPFWLSGAWSGIKNILPDSVQVDILSESKYLAALREYIDDDQIPKEYGGSSAFKLDEHPYEKELKCLVQRPVNNYSESRERYNIHLSPPNDFKQIENESLTSMGDDVSDANGQSRPTDTKSSASQPLRRRMKSVEFAVSLDDESHDDYLPIQHKLSRVKVACVLVIPALIQGCIEFYLLAWLTTPQSLGGINMYLRSCCLIGAYISIALIAFTKLVHFGSAVQITKGNPLRVAQVSLAVSCVTTYIVVEGYSQDSLLMICILLIVCTMSVLLLRSSTYLVYLSVRKKSDLDGTSTVTDNRNASIACQLAISECVGIWLAFTNWVLCAQTMSDTAAVDVQQSIPYATYTLQVLLGVLLHFSSSNADNPTVVDTADAPTSFFSPKAAIPNDVETGKVGRKSK